MDFPDEFSSVTQTVLAVPSLYVYFLYKFVGDDDGDDDDDDDDDEEEKEGEENTSRKIQQP